MEIEHKKYPKIGQLKDVCYEVRRKASYAGQDEDDNPIYKDPGKLPTLLFQGTVKLHGTNAAIRWDRIDGNWQVSYQSRNNLITPEKDNAGFAQWASERVDKLQALIPFPIDTKEIDSIVLYGEYCGGNIQKGVALTQLPKMFVVFNMFIEGNVNLIDLPHSHPDWEDIFTIHEFPVYMKEIDFNFPEKSGNEILPLVEAIENECPVGKALGVSGTGEGIVWKCLDPEWSELMFKTKGEKHSKSPVKTLNPVDIEKLERVRAIAVTIMTPERCQQGLDYLTEMQLDHSRRNTAQYLKHVVGDCMVEEKLTIAEAGVDPKLLGKQLSQVAKDWFFERV